MGEVVGFNSRWVAFWVLLLYPNVSAQPTSVADFRFPITDGQVFTAVQTNGTLFIGGNFSQVGPLTGAFAALSPSTGRVVPPVPDVWGTALCSISDLRGGLYFGGVVNGAGSVATTNLAHLGPTGIVDSEFAFSFDDQVSALALYGNKLVVGGGFTTVNGQSRPYLAMLEVDSNQLTPFTISIDGPVLALAVNGSTLFLGGAFNQISGLTRKHLAAIDLTTGQVTLWDPSPDAIFGHGVGVLVAGDSRVYAAGDFTQIAGAARNRIAAFDASSGALLPWDARVSAPWTDHGVYAVAVSSNSVFIGGNFTSLGGQARSQIGAVDKTVGDALAWNPGIPSDNVYALAVSDNTVYVGGTFTGIGAGGPARLAAVDATSGTALPWTPSPGGIVRTILPLNGLVYAGGGFSSVGGIHRELLAAIDLATGLPASWNANMGGSSISGDAVFALAIYGDTLFVGGRFHGIGGQSRGSLGAVRLSDGNLLPFQSGVAGYLLPQVFGLCVAGTNLVVTLSPPVPGPVVVNATTGDTVPWSFGVDGTVNSVVVAGSSLFAGGTFTSASGQSRCGLAAFDANSGQLLPWHPVVGGTVSAITARDQSIIVWGTFGTANGQSRSNLAVFDSVSGDLALGPTALTLDAGLRDLTTSSGSLYLAGDFTEVNGLQRTSFAAVDLVSGQTRPWNPGAFVSSSSGWFRTVLTDDEIIIADGFSSAGGSPVTGIARFPVTNPPPSVRIHTPTNQTIVHAPAQLPLQVHATSASSSISNVDVYVRTDLLLRTASGSLVTNWSVPKHIGDYLVTAVAYDQYGESSFSPAARVTVLLPTNYISPDVSITFPSNGATYAPFSTIQIQTAITNPRSAVESVQFLLETNLVATVTNGPYTATLTNMSPGTYSVTAVLEDEFGVVVTSAPVSFRINNPPHIWLQNPPNGLVVSSSTVLPFLPVATDSDGFIRDVAFFSTTNLIGTVTNAPFSLVWSNPPSGYFTVYAIATDDFGTTATSSVANITIFPGPEYDLILDNTNTNVAFLGTWSTGTDAYLPYGPDYRLTSCSVDPATATAVYTPVIPVAALFDVFIWYPFIWYSFEPLASSNSQWLISYEGGATNITVDQTQKFNDWRPLASALRFGVGTNSFVSVSNNTGEDTNRIVTADAIRLTSSTVPFIISQPQSLAVKAGAEATFAVSATGSSPLLYQWRFNGTNLLNATASSLTLTGVQPANAGPYVVVVSNALSFATSSNAILTVFPPEAPRLSLASLTADGQLNLTLTADPGLTFGIEVSSNLRDWSVLTSLLNTSGQVRFIDAITNDASRFYRARWLSP